MPTSRKTVAAAPAPAPALQAHDGSRGYRTGAVARMVRMPAATLRIWERRYRVVAPATAPSGHRLYSSADVQRLALLKQLTDVGHAIGSIASLDLDALHQVAATHAGTLAAARAQPEPVRAAWRLAVVGAGLANRLQRASVRHWIGRPMRVVGVYPSLGDATAARARPALDLLLVHTPGLQLEGLAELRATADALGAPRAAVLYGYAAASVGDALQAAGMSLLREPQTDKALGLWLHGLGELAGPREKRLPLTPVATNLRGIGSRQVPPRRYDDATLADIAGLSTTIACECPRHVAELLIQLSQFDAYSAECADRSPGDAALHGYLQRVAGASRALFEAALEHVAIHEGLVLPG